MSAYVIVSYDITDPQAFAPYVAGVMPLIARHGGEVVVADDAATTLEGAPRHMEVVLRFPDRAAAQAWYEDPDYAPVRQIRLNATTHERLVIAAAFTPPGG